ncbi:E3 ubiquitin-protein ligase RNF135 [Perognathus longimembris pacificus]|uniref:E3 ubiquitin-protein ligase RNF135 n=1 Tax=Perognathus longimembris pacificus TaxID=214514 RepID=UPI002018A7A0|nr:E3 ubiquitin-protein ligase RNF135 [Perognathus longimembris pacificus]
MAGPGSSSAIPVWLAEDDLSCIICHGLLAWPTTLACGHSFCYNCLMKMWGARGAGVAEHSWACPTCRKGAAQRPQLSKNTLLQYLVDKYSRAARELEEGWEPAGDHAHRASGGHAYSHAQEPDPQLRRCGEQPPMVGQKNTTEVAQELTELTGELVAIVKSLQRQRCLSGSGADNELSILDKTSLQTLFLASPEPVIPSASEGKTRNILQDLKEIQEKLQRILTWNAATKEQTQVDVLAVPSSSSCPLTGQNFPASRRASQWAIYPSFDLRTLSCSLEVSTDCRTVTVSHQLQSYLWTPERFSISQVLCSQALSSGQQYWEVDTSSCSHWAVGVASWSMNRNQRLGRTMDSWCIEWKGTGQFSAWTMNKKTDLDLDRPRVVGIWLDLELGKLAFYSVAKIKRFLFECEVSTSSCLHPAFWLYGLSPGNSLSIKQVET